MTDGEALLVANPMPVGVDDAEKIVEAWNPYRTMFDVVWSGRRHVMMGASQIDPYGNQNFAFIGDGAQPKASSSACAARPATPCNHTTSYWIPNHSHTVFVPKVDVVSGVGYDRAAELGEWVTRAPRDPARGHQPRRARLRDARPPHAPRERAPRRDRRRSGRGHRLRARRSTATCRRAACPTDEELAVIEQARSHGLRAPGGARADARPPPHPPLRPLRRRRTRSCRPAWAGSPARASCRPPRRPAALGILASATMDFRQLQNAIADVKTRTPRPVRREPARRRRRHRPTASSC